MVQVQQESNIYHSKNVIDNQQTQIEAFEEDSQCSLTVSNFKETDFVFDGDAITSEDKIFVLFNHILPTGEALSSRDVVSTTRFGRSGRSTQILKVRLSSVHYRNKILRSCRHLNDEAVRRALDTIFVNKDMSFFAAT